MFKLSKTIEAGVQIVGSIMFIGAAFFMILIERHYIQGGLMLFWGMWGLPLAAYKLGIDSTRPKTVGDEWSALLEKE